MWNVRVKPHQARNTSCANILNHNPLDNVRAMRRHTCVELLLVLLCLSCMCAVSYYSYTPEEGLGRNIYIVYFVAMPSFR